MCTSLQSQSRPSVVGCFSQLIVNRRTLDLSSPDSREGAFGCPSVVSNVASFGGSGYVQLMDSWFPGERFEVSLQFRTTVCDGILFYLANTDIDNGDYILLELVDGRVSSYPWVCILTRVCRSVFMYVCVPLHVCESLPMSVYSYMCV